MGHWEQNTAKWYEQTMVYCNLCGRIIPKTFWIVGEGTEKLVFCDLDCEQLYQDYWLPAQKQEP